MARYRTVNLYPKVKEQLEGFLEEDESHSAGLKRLLNELVELRLDRERRTKGTG